MADRRFDNQRSRLEWLIEHSEIRRPYREETEKSTGQKILVQDAELLSEDFPWIDKETCRLNGYRKVRIRDGTHHNLPTFTDVPYPKTRSKKPRKANGAESSIAESPAHDRSAHPRLPASMLSDEHEARRSMSQFQASRRRPKEST